MVKLKRMLGDIDDPTVVVLMALIESQSAETLANWSLNYVEQNLLSIYQDKYPDDARLKHIICETRKSKMLRRQLYLWQLCEQF